MKGVAAALAAALLLYSFPASAHDAVEGGLPFFNGVLHPLIEPAHLLILLGLGLWAARLPNERRRAEVVGFAVMMIVGLGLSFAAVAVPPISLAAGALIAGGIAAAMWTPPAWAGGFTSALGGLAIGLDSANEWDALIGTWIGAHVVFLGIVALTMKVERPWLIVLTRAAGAWIAAAALMVLALQSRGYL